MWPLVKINPIIKIKNWEKNKTLAKTGCVILDRVRIKKCMDTPHGPEHSKLLAQNKSSIRK